jgi:hypothetical protein
VVQLGRAAEERDLGFIMEQISAGFRTDEGWTRDELKGYLAARLLGGQWLRVFPVGVETHLVSPAQVGLTGTFIFGGSKAASIKDLVRDSAFSAEHIDATFEKEADGAWRAVRASHRALSQQELLGQSR